MRVVKGFKNTSGWLLLLLQRFHFPLQVHFQAISYSFISREILQDVDWYLFAGI